MALTLTGSILLGLPFEAGLDAANPNVFSAPFTTLLNNTFLAILYLALSFLFMVAIDVRAIIKEESDAPLYKKRKGEKQQQTIEK